MRTNVLGCVGVENQWFKHICTQVTTRLAKQPASAPLLSSPPRFPSFTFMCFFLPVIEPDITLYSPFIPVLFAALSRIVLLHFHISRTSFFCADCNRSLLALFFCICVGEVSEGRGDMIRRLCNCFCLMMILCVLFVPFGLISSMWREPYSLFLFFVLCMCGRNWG